MGINDPVYLHFYVRRGTWILLQGRETFYDEEDVLVERDTIKEILEWAEEKGIKVVEDYDPRSPRVEDWVENGR